MVTSITLGEHILRRQSVLYLLRFCSFSHFYDLMKRGKGYKIISFFLPKILSYIIKCIHNSSTGLGDLLYTMIILLKI